MEPRMLHFGPAFRNETIYLAVRQRGASKMRGLV
jgi:hypothetical protein